MMAASLPSRPPGSRAPAVPFLHRPDPRALREVAEVLARTSRAMEERGPVDLDMEAHRMEVLHPEHRTVGSIGGWYALGSKDLKTQWVPDDGDERRSVLAFEGEDARARGGWGDAVAWSFEGEQAIAAALGFRAADELLEWAGRHPEWWGNDWGRRMFRTAQAYGCDPEAPIGIVLVDWHWRQVAGRMERMTLWGAMSAAEAVREAHARGLVRSTAIERGAAMKRLDPEKTPLARWAGRIAAEIVAECEELRADPWEICGRWRAQLDWMLRLAPGEIARVNEAFQACGERRAEQAEAWKRDAGVRRGMGI